MSEFVHSVYVILLLAISYPELLLVFKKNSGAYLHGKTCWPSEPNKEGGLGLVLSLHYITWLTSMRLVFKMAGWISHSLGIVLRSFSSALALFRSNAPIRCRHLHIRWNSIRKMNGETNDSKKKKGLTWAEAAKVVCESCFYRLI